MKRPIQALSEDQLLKIYPIKGTVEGWYFRVVETSSNVWLVEGSDRWGRQVSKQGTDPDELRAQCEADAAELSTKTGDG